MQRYIIQTHIHGSASEGPASYAAHDFAAIETGVDAIWCMDHDWRIVNYAKVKEFAFDEQVEYMQIPARHGQAGETNAIAMTWEPVEAPSGTTATICTDTVHSGSGSLLLELPGGGGQCAYEFRVQVRHASFPMFTRPKVGIAVCPKKGLRNGGAAFVRFTLSQQPPDLRRPELFYALGDPTCLLRSETSVVIPRTWSQNDWTELWLDPAADVEELAIPGGLDNSLSSIQIGVAGTGETVAACFDSLRIEPGVTGNQAFILQKELLRGLPLKHHWLVGAEVSYYGQHINAFGSQVPVPDYEALGGPLSTADVVEHIHRYGGLACYNHPPVTNLGATAATLIENRAGGADLMEVAHSHRHLQERLLLWDRLGKSGLVITGIAASDAHHAGHGWRPVPAMPASYVNHVWAESLQEKDLLASLKAGRTYVADPMAFRGTLDITGPGDIRMGDVVLAQSEWPALQATLTGVQPGDLAVWLLDGHLVNVSHVQEECHVFQWRAPAAVPGFHVARLQVHRPSLAADPFGGLIAASNPVYVTDTPPETSRRIVRV